MPKTIEQLNAEFEARMEKAKQDELNAAAEKAAAEIKAAEEARKAEEARAVAEAGDHLEPLTVWQARVEQAHAHQQDGRQCEADHPGMETGVAQDHGRDATGRFRGLR